MAICDLRKTRFKSAMPKYLKWSLLIEKNVVTSFLTEQCTLLRLQDLEDRDMNTCRFSIAYDGIAVADGRMSIKDLAPALLAVGELFDAANAILNEDAAKVEAHVKATSEGSFEVFLEFVQTGLLNQVVSLFSGDKVTAILQMKELIFGTLTLGGGGVIALVKCLRGKKASNIEN